jgi:hypothetical protein
MKKRIVFLKDLESPGKQVVWRKGKPYEIVFENNDLYLLEEQNGIVCGVDKADCDQTYEVKVDEI